MAERIFSGDTAILSTALVEDDGVNTVSVNDVIFEALGPNDKSLLATSLPSDPETGDRVGLIQAVVPYSQWDILEYDGTTWNDIGDMIP